jgi:hypothetical protein
MGATCRHVLLAVLMVVAYAAVYFALVDRDTSRINLNNTAHLDATYGCGGRYAHAFFAPAHCVDRRIRQEYWEPGAPEALDLLIANLDKLRPSCR